MIDGIFNVRKAKGMTSHDVVGKMRKILNTKKIGHGGTLDPMAEGVLPIFVGKATRLLEYALEGDKTYEAIITFGEKTDTGDAEGKVVNTGEVISLTKEQREEVLQRFRGDLQQIPPMYSALKFQGRKLYDYARQGIEIDRPARNISIYELTELSYDVATLKIRVQCSKGTYIRKLAEDIADAFGMFGNLSYLCRTKVGIFILEDAHTLEDLKDNYSSYILPLELGIKDLPKLVVNPWQGKRIAQGVPTTIKNIEEGMTYALETTEGLLVGIVKAKNSRICAEKILNCPEVQENSNEKDNEFGGTEKG